jgi:transketolase
MSDSVKAAAAMPLDTPRQPIDQLTINTIRTLSMDAVQKANSGHPGTPMALAPLAYTIFDRFLKHNPKNPHWANRDRFVLSNGHASMLLYSMLYLTGYGLTLEDLKSFRQWNSKTPGHPEYHHTPGVETTTGPLGQGISNSVGMAIAERWIAAHFNRPGHEIFNYTTYVICGDGDLMEGVSHETAAMAGHLGLSNLVWMYDNNHITIEGSTSLAYSDDVKKRFEGYHWNVLHVTDANSLDQIGAALTTATTEPDKPTMIIVDSHIGYGAPTRQDTKEAHGEPLGDGEIEGAKKFYGWPTDAKFLVPPEVLEHMRSAEGRGAEWEAEWNKKFAAYKAEYPELAREWEMIMNRELPDGWDSEIPTFPADAKGVASRESSGKVLNAIAKHVPWLLGGSADLAPSTKTLLAGEKSFEKDSYGGRNLHFGIREHGMAAILNGMALSGLRPYGASFLIFSDYSRPAIRLSALMDLPVIHIFTHDSIGLGEDGPTHQPIEQFMTLRAIPRMLFIRPADANEVAESWRVIMKQKKHPVILALSRQALPTFDRTKYASAAGVAKGAYVLADCDGAPEVILMSSGSEVKLCLVAYETLKSEGVKVRVVSMPCWEIFEEQSAEYKEQVLPNACRARVAVEAGTNLGWDYYTGLDGYVLCRTDFGASAPATELFTQFGFTPENVANHARKLIGKGK